MSKTIPLTQGKWTIVDDEDYEWLNQWKWYYHLSGTGYAVRNVRVGRKQSKQLMHRLILDVPHGMETDHINHDGLDNRRANLRVCSRTENKTNSRKYRNNTSGYMGVHWDKETDKWRAQVNSHKLGRFDDVEDAARAYDAAAVKMHGEFATLNFAGGLEP